MNIIQKKLMKYHHGYFMALGLLIGLTAIGAKILMNEPVTIYDMFAVLGALTLGYGTGRCDQKTCS
jgi:hypothetical protein